MGATKHLGECLVEAGLLDAERIQTALDIQERQGGFLGEILVKFGWIGERDMCVVLSKILHSHWVNLEGLLISRDVLRLVPRSIAMISNVLPLLTQRQVLYLAMENPEDTSMIKFIEFHSGMQVKPFLAPVKQLRNMVRQYYFEPTDAELS